MATTHIRKMTAATGKGLIKAIVRVSSGARLMSCKCVAQVNKQLAKDNTRVVTNLFDRSHIFIMTEVIKKKRGSRAKRLIAAYCPFCGGKLED